MTEDIGQEIRRLSWERAELARDMDVAIEQGIYIGQEVWGKLDALTERIRELRLRLEALEAETGEA